MSIHSRRGGCHVNGLRGASLSQVCRTVEIACSTAFSYNASFVALAAQTLGGTVAA